MTVPEFTDAERDLVAVAIANRTAYSQHGNACPVWKGRPKGVWIARRSAPTDAELARCDCWVLSHARGGAGRALAALAAAGWRKSARPGCICPTAGVLVRPDCGAHALPEGR